MNTFKIFLCGSFVFALISTLNAGMLQVTGVVDATTIAVAQNGTTRAIRIADLDVAPDDEAAARAYLATLTGAWILAEPAGGNAAYIYRSPDVLFVNREMIRRGLASIAPAAPTIHRAELQNAARQAQEVASLNALNPGATHPMTYLGQSDPAPRSRLRRVAETRAAAPPPPPARPHRKPRTTSMPVLRVKPQTETR